MVTDVNFTPGITSAQVYKNVEEVPPPPPQCLCFTCLGKARPRRVRPPTRIDRTTALHRTTDSRACFCALVISLVTNMIVCFLSLLGPQVRKFPFLRGIILATDSKTGIGWASQSASVFLLDVRHPILVVLLAAWHIVVTISLFAYSRNHRAQVVWLLNLGIHLLSQLTCITESFTPDKSHRFARIALAATVHVVVNFLCVAWALYNTAERLEANRLERTTSITDQIQGGNECQKTAAPTSPSPTLPQVNSTHSATVGLQAANSSRTLYYTPRSQFVNTVHTGSARKQQPWISQGVRKPRQPKAPSGDRKTQQKKGPRRRKHTKENRAC